MAAAVLLLGGGGWLWAASLLPSAYAMTDMGYPDYGGGPEGAGHPGHHDAGGIDITTLVPDPALPADVRVDLVARAERISLPGVPDFDGFTLNGSTPGPAIRARAGQLVEVRVTNDNVADGMTLHWHGVDLPNAMDGVAGVTQDAIKPGESHVYRFVAQEGTYWYHSHQVPNPQVVGGLLGALVVDPAASEPASLDVLALVHGYGGRRTVNAQPGDSTQLALPGEAVRVRVINTDAGPMPGLLDRGRPVGHLQLDQDDRHQVPDGLVGDAELPGDPRVVPALRQQGQRLPLPAGQLDERPARLAGRHGGEPGRERGREDDVAVGDGADRRQGGVRGRGLHHVAAGAGRDRVGDAGVVQHGQHQHPCLGRGGDDPAGGLDPVQAGHGEIHHHHLGAEFGREPDGFQPVRRLPHHHQVLSGAEQADQALAIERMVVHDQHAEGLGHRCLPSGRAARSRVPPPGLGPIVHRPPSSAARSRMAVRPTPAWNPSGEPSPSSATSISKATPLRRRVTQHSVAWAWRATLARAAEAMR
jgi:hypothetical protein